MLLLFEQMMWCSKFSSLESQASFVKLLALSTFVQSYAIYF